MFKPVFLRIVLSLCSILALTALGGCAKSSSDDEVSQEDAKTAFSAVHTFFTYANPEEWLASWTGPSTEVSATEQSYLSPDGAFSWDCVTDSVDFDTYPQNRTYKMTGKKLAITGSEYTINGSLTMHLLFPAEGSSPTKMDVTFDMALSGGDIEEISGSMSSKDMSSYSGTITCDGTDFTAAELMN